MSAEIKQKLEDVIAAMTAACPLQTRLIEVIREKCMDLPEHFQRMLIGIAVQMTELSLQQILFMVCADEYDRKPIEEHLDGSKN